MPTLDELKDKTAVAEELFLTTRRATGRATYPSWFVHDGQRLYMLAAESAAEVWDIRRDPTVDVAIGAPDTPDHLAMQADIMTEASWVPQMIDLLQRKYGTEYAERMQRTADSARSGHIIIKLKPLV